MTSEIIPQPDLPPYEHKEGPQSATGLPNTSEKLPQFPQPSVAEPTEGAQVPQFVQGAPDASLGQQYRDQLFAQCAMGNHERKTDYGIFGIIVAVMCFPIGLICLFMDKEEKCARCGVLLDKKKK